MEPTDLTIEILKGIRDEVSATSRRMDMLQGGLDGFREDINTRLEDISRRVVESEIRISTAIADLAGTVREVTGVLRGQTS